MQSSYVENQVREYNVNLKKFTLKVVKERKELLLKRKGIAEGLGIPIRRSGAASETLSIPVKKKRINILKPSTSDKAYLPEPFLEKGTYLQILKACSDLGIAMERHPSTYEGKNEEAIRDLLLLTLNVNFESVTGETFNKKGKTDILIRHENRNIFVGECKFWRGPKNHQETIDQILSYLTWRDSKAAILYFVNNKELQPILNNILSLTESHSCHLKTLDQKEEGGFNFKFYLKEDKTRSVEINIQFFHLINLR